MSADERRSDNSGLSGQSRGTMVKCNGSNLLTVGAVHQFGIFTSVDLDDVGRLPNRPGHRMLSWHLSSGQGRSTMAPARQLRGSVHLCGHFRCVLGQVRADRKQGYVIPTSLDESSRLRCGWQLMAMEVSPW